MSTVVNQKSYLQKYLGGPSKEKKKKKKAIKGKGFKIIDDDIDLSKLRPLEGDELDILDEGEDAPQVAGIVDDRPEELRKLDPNNTSSKWRVINQDDGFNSNLQIQEIQKDRKAIEKENEVIFGKMYSDSEDEKQNDSDLSPPRKTSKNDSDISPPRKGQSKKNYNDVEAKTQKVRKPSRWANAETNSPRNDSKSNNSDLSPPRKKRYDSDESPPRKKNTQSKNRRSISSDLSPPRKSQSLIRKGSKNRRDLDGNTKRRIQNSDLDISPPRKDRDRSKDMRVGKKQNSDSDLSPPRKNKDVSKDMQERNRNKNRSHSPKRKDSDSDIAPPRRDRDKNTSKRGRSPHNRQKQDSDSDLSPPRKARSNNEANRDRYISDKDRNMSGRDRNMSERDRYTSHRDKNIQRNDSPPPSNKKMAKTLEGKMAGLQNAKQLRDENEEFRRKEEEVFRRLGDEVSGRNAQAVSRKGKRDTSEDRQKQKEKAERQKELDAKYQMWSKGIKQVEAQQARMQDFIHEASKPVTRHRDDKDLERSLKQVERDGDPMMQYMREKKRERGELPPERPSYKGSFPPNRFNIRPGYRWDGVDRSNGYENKFFQQQNKRKAQEEEAYKWSTEDL